MINIFQASAQDQSIYYLGQVFGVVGNVLVPADAPMLLGVMFKTFNSIVLAVGALIIVYVTVVGVIQTAHEGEFLGKHWNKLWVPLRMVLGIATLVPSTSGYSVIQMIMMWIVIQGIGAADTIWTTVLQYVQAFGSPYTTFEIPSVNVNNSIQSLFQALVCQASAKDSNVRGRASYCALGNPNRDQTFCNRSSDDLLNISKGASQVTVVGGNIQYKLGPGGACGTLTYGDKELACSLNQLNMDNALKCATFTAQQPILQNIVTTLGGVANKFVEADNGFIEFYRNATNTNAVSAPAWIASYCAANNVSAEGCCREIPTDLATKWGLNIVRTCSLPGDLKYSDPNSLGNADSGTVNKLYWPYKIKPEAAGDVDFIDASVNSYVNNIRNAAMAVIQQRAASTTLTPGSVLAEAQDYGWIFAGSYYYYLGKQNNNNFKASVPDLAVSQADPQSDRGNALYPYRNNYTAAGNLLAQLASQTGGVAAMIPPTLGQLSALSSTLSSATKNISNIFFSMMGGIKKGEPRVDPIIKIQQSGFIMLFVAQLTFAIIAIGYAVLSIVAWLSPTVLGTGLPVNPFGAAMTTLAIFIVPIFMAFLGALFTFGGMLAIYIPLIPYVIFTVGAIGWFLLVIEAMIAAPLVALGILSPGGEHEVLGRAQPAMMLIFGIFLRPGLMIFGMIAGMLLAMMVVTLINTGFMGVLGQMSGQTLGASGGKAAGFGLVELLLFMGAYVMLVVTALNKCFSLIHIIPERVMRWISAPAGEAVTAEEMLGAAKGGAAAAGGAMAGYGAGAISRGKAAEKPMRKGGEKGEKKKAGGRDVGITDATDKVRKNE